MKRLIIVCACIAVHSLCAVFAEESGGLGKTAIESYLQGDSETAIRLLETIVQTDPDDADTRAFLLKIYSEKINEYITQNNRTAALLTVSKAIKLDPNNKELAGLANSLSGTEKSKLAAEAEGARKISKENTAVVRKVVDKVKVPPDYYLKFINAIEELDQKIEKSLSVSEVKTLNSVLSVAAPFGALMVLLIAATVRYYAVRHEKILKETGDILIKMKQPAQPEQKMVELQENNKVRSIGIIDAEFSSVAEQKTGRDLLLEFINDPNPKVRSLAILTMNRFDRDESIRMIRESLGRKDNALLELLAENATNFPANYAAEVLVMLQGKGGEELDSCVFLGMKRVLQKEGLDVDIKHKIEKKLADAKRAGWVI